MEAATELTTVTSQTTELPLYHGISNMPSGILPSSHEIPTGYLTAVMPALTTEQYIYYILQGLITLQATRSSATKTMVSFGIHSSTALADR